MIEAMTHRGRLPRRALVIIAGVALTWACVTRTEEAPAQGVTSVKRSEVTALGRVTPGRAVMSVAAQPGSRLLKLAVNDGTRVKAGDVLAYLESYTTRTADRDAARVALDEARRRLQAETGYAEAVIEQNRKAVGLLDIAVEHERRELQRLTSVASALPQQRLDDQRFRVESREAELDKARAELRAGEAALTRTRSTIAVDSAAAQLKSAEAQLELAIIRAPIDGEILKIFTYPGERIGNEPILTMGDTSDMHVIAEVHETDVGAVRVGQRATMTSDALSEPLHGVVDEIGSMIYRNTVPDQDPRAPKDTRVVEVRIKLDKAEAVARLTHLEVSTRIDLNTPGGGRPSSAR